MACQFAGIPDSLSVNDHLSSLCSAVGVELLWPNPNLVLLWSSMQVWNDDLLRAFRVRMEFSRANEKP